MRISAICLGILVLTTCRYFCASPWLVFRITPKDGVEGLPGISFRDLPTKIGAGEEPIVSISLEYDWVKIAIPMTRERAHSVRFDRHEKYLVFNSASSEGTFVLLVQDDAANALFSARTYERKTDDEGLVTSTYSGQLTICRPYVLPAAVIIDDRVRTTYENDELIIRLPRQ